MEEIRRWAWLLNRRPPNRRQRLQWQLWTLTRHARHLVVVISVRGRRGDSRGPTVGNGGRRQRSSGRLRVSGIPIRLKIGLAERRGRRGAPLPVQDVPRGERHRQVR